MFCKKNLLAAPFFCALAAFCFFFFSCASIKLEAGVQSESSNQGGEGFLNKIFQSAEVYLPERYEELPQGFSAATFKTNVPKAALYINGEYHGLTPLNATGLVPGTYVVQIKKRGYQIVNITIQVKDGVSDFYYIELEPVESAPQPKPEIKESEPSEKENDEPSKAQEPDVEKTSEPQTKEIFVPAKNDFVEEPEVKDLPAASSL